MNRLVGYFLLAITGSLMYSCYSIKHKGSPIPANTLKGKSFQNITLETSLKPFKKNDKAYIKSVAREMFTQWSSLLRHADTVCIMLWTSDGSEILNYKGKQNQPLEWAKYIGNPNTKHAVGSGPKELSLHERAYLYMENPPDFTCNDLRLIIHTLKEVGAQVTGKPIKVGSTFDPGPEFARSDFKYKKHPEILLGNAMGTKSFVNCYSVLNADKDSYAGFPKGIPANTPFGRFFGRQSYHFLKDMGFDYLWLSNGFGFGMEAWSSKGAIFDGKEFDAGKLAEVQAKNLEFWKIFRMECPRFQVQTRGTNLSTGTDLARDGVDLRGIYKGGFNLLPPPNSPWAALDGDFGMELVGYMSRISELPDNRYLFRYYTHDPWWVNSPWFDRYGGEPHDIYMPMAVSRIDSNGGVTLPTQLNFLSIDNSFGNIPAQVPDEVIPHILKARYDAPTVAGPFVWVYPFDEYHDWTYKQKDRLKEVYFGDWFIRQAINNGFPLNTVISTRSFNRLMKSKPGYFKESVLLTVVPDAGSVLEKELIRFVENGGKVMIYGPADHASEKFLDLLNLKNISPLEGEFQIQTDLQGDQLEQPYPKKMLHQALFSAGGIRTLVKDKSEKTTHVLMTAKQGEEQRAVLWSRARPEWNGGKLVYVRGTSSSSAKNEKLLTPDSPSLWATGPLYLRYALQEFGYYFLLEKESPAIKSPVLTLSRSNNGFYFSGYVPGTTAKQVFKFPQGAPLLTGFETKLEKGFSTYNLPTAWHKECRVFVEQEEGIVSVKETYPGDATVSRRIEIKGLKNAVIRVFPDDGITKDKLKATPGSAYPWRGGKIEVQQAEEEFGNSYLLKNVTGTLVLAW
ncbi:hypothetical protein SAMN04487898_106277 [Pedobacter sp. ok626]|uniref:hypothetical protein n=1 Tax=Pedobacter sp. ok626 TaxID=1761882 RepID=UPI0008846261|nr:hypothetical protein [Pedobacter sp. ok626]SDK19095.1 hypothetical protein SAMN04487898_106277 [Pedobacter sp. ok626]